MFFNLLNPISTTTLLIVIAIIAALSIAFTVFIVLVSKLCAVPVDEKAEKIKEQLAGANCGGCGFAGCADFAKALSEGRAEIFACGPTPNENKKIIAEIIGVEFADEEPKFAVVHCNGGDNCLNKFEYVGNEGCEAQSAFMGGKKMCAFGCLGGGSCEKACLYNAVKISDNLAGVDRSLCEACGICVKTCPKHIIDLIPKTSKVYVACSSQCKGKDVMSACKVGCIGCGICAKSCPEGAISMQNNYPVIDNKKCGGCLICVDKCPRKCIKEIK